MQIKPNAVPTAVLPTKLITCQRSGLPLATVTAMCSYGWPLLSSFQSALLHPIYNMPLSKLLVDLRAGLDTAEQHEWLIVDSEQQSLAITMSAIMYSLDAIWQPSPEAVFLWKHLEPSLPSWPVVVATGRRLEKLASWYHFATSKRLDLPKYRVSRKNDNLEWQNFRSWLDDAFAVKEVWESGRDKLATEEELRRRTAALKEVRSDNVFKRIDVNKVWNWIDIQMAKDGRYPLGRRETFKTIFLKADQTPEDWTLDDVEDVQLAITETCDLGNDISYYINNRIKHIRANIQDFYSSFTLLGSSNVAGLAALDVVTVEERAATEQFFSSFDKRANELQTLPPEPKRESFASFPKFLQAQAQWNILRRRHDLINTPIATVVQTATNTQTGEQA